MTAKDRMSPHQRSVGHLMHSVGLDQMFGSATLHPDLGVPTPRGDSYRYRSLVASLCFNSSKIRSIARTVLPASGIVVDPHLQCGGELGEGGVEQGEVA